MRHAGESPAPFRAGRVRGEGDGVSANLVELLRSAASSDVTSGLRTDLLAELAHIESEPDWRSVAIALCVKYGTAEGVALIGSGTLKWARERVDFRVDRDGDAVRLRWSAPPLNALPERE